MSIKETLSAAAGKCECGKTHELPHITVESGKGAFDTLMSHIDSFGAIHPYILSDKNTEAVAGKKVKEMLEKSGKAYTSCLFECDKPVPDEKSVGYAIMNYTSECDIIISVGSGVMNDIGKIAANVTGSPIYLSPPPPQWTALPPSPLR